MEDKAFDLRLPVAAFLDILDVSSFSENSLGLLSARAPEFTAAFAFDFVVLARTFLTDCC